MRDTKRLFSVFLLLPLFTTPTDLFGGEAERKTTIQPATKPDFVLTVKDSLISLKAKDASLKEVLEEIGRRMNVEVVGNVPSNEKVTAEFEKLPLQEAVQRLSTNYSFQIDSEKTGKRITKVVVLDKGKETGTVKTTDLSKKEQSPAGPREETATKEPEPFKFIIGDPEPKQEHR
jgi:type II secretory pathway component GspD/PulD (secretin)